MSLSPALRRPSPHVSPDVAETCSGEAPVRAPTRASLRWLVVCAALLIGCHRMTVLPPASPLPVYPDPAQTPEVRRFVLEREMLAAIDSQRVAWKEDERLEHDTDYTMPLVRELLTFRRRMLHCHFDGSYPSGSPRAARAPGEPLERMPMMVRSRVRRVALCPNWPPIQDVGKAVTLHRRIKDSTLHRFPASLEAALDSLASEMPDDLWILRQRVRIAVDHRDPVRIRQVLVGCTVNEWCDLFSGYASYLEGNWQSALTTWQSVLGAMFDEERCQMLSAVELVYGSTNDDLEAPCIERAALDRDVWWLGKPLFGDSLNYRGIEHVARVIRTDLVSDLPRDVHFDLRETHGGDVVQQMRVRYGWPVHHYWGGDAQDMGHRQYLSVNGGPPHHDPPYVSPEYSPDAASTMPTLKAALAPYSITDDAFAVDRQRDSEGNEVWPQEFFTHPFGLLIGIRTHQRALLRRDSSALLVVSTMLPTPPIENGPHARVPLQLYSSVAPDSLQLLTELQTSWGTRAFISGNVHRPTVIGLEVHRGGERIAGARSRFGIPQVTTHANAVESCGLSQPILLDAATLTGNGMRDLERGMLSDTRLTKPVRLGVMWESYGARVSDSATLRVRVLGVANRSGFWRVAQALRVIGRQEVAIEVSWREPTAQQQVEVIEARVPTLSRQLTIDVSSLRTGNYGLQLSMTTRRCESVSEVRDFSISR